jgi:hypothetical protein
MLVLALAAIVMETAALSRRKQSGQMTQADDA